MKTVEIGTGLLSHKARVCWVLRCFGGSDFAISFIFIIISSFEDFFDNPNGWVNQSWSQYSTDNSLWSATPIRSWLHVWACVVICFQFLSVERPLLITYLEVVLALPGKVHMFAPALLRLSSSVGFRQPVTSSFGRSRQGRPLPRLKIWYKTSGGHTDIRRRELE